MLRVLLCVSLLPALLVGCQRSMVSASTAGDSLPDAADGSMALADLLPSVADAEGPAVSEACAPALIGPRSTMESPRETVPWIVVLTTDGGVPGSDAGASGDGGAPSGCASNGGEAEPGTPDVVCSGKIVARRLGDGLDLALADGSILHWDATVTSPVSPPALADGQTAVVSYSRRTTFVCPFCGSYETTEMQIRMAEAGPLIWIGRQGTKLAEVSPDVVQDLFGAGSRAQSVCHSTFTAGCFNVTRQVFDHVVETTPEQAIPAATSRHITTSKGEFDVFWTHSSENSTFQTNCNDGPAVASDNGFAASRTAAPPAPLMP